MPGEDLPLRIFEPRYLQLIEEAKTEGFTFVIPFMQDGEMTDYGCEVKLQQVVAESEQGRKVITVEAVSLVSIGSYTEQMTGKLYSGGSVERLEDKGFVQSVRLKNLVLEHAEHFESDVTEKWADGHILYSDLIRSLHLSSEDKYQFILMQDDHQREAYLVRQMEYLNLIRNQERMLNNDFRLN